MNEKKRRVGVRKPTLLSSIINYFEAVVSLFLANSSPSPKFDITVLHEQIRSPLTPLSSLVTSHSFGPSTNTSRAVWALAPIAGII